MSWHVLHALRLRGSLAIVLDNMIIWRDWIQYSVLAKSFGKSLKYHPKLSSFRWKETTSCDTPAAPCLLPSDALKAPGGGTYCWHATPAQPCWHLATNLYPRFELQQEVAAGSSIIVETWHKYFSAQDNWSIPAWMLRNPNISTWMPATGASCTLQWLVQWSSAV